MRRQITRRGGENLGKVGQPPHERILVRAGKQRHIGIGEYVQRRVDRFACS
jgi:hypothetical protein